MVSKQQTLRQLSCTETEPHSLANLSMIEVKLFQSGKEEVKKPVSEQQIKVTEVGNDALHATQDISLASSRMQQSQQTKDTSEMSEVLTCPFKVFLFSKNNRFYQMTM